MLIRLFKDNTPSAYILLPLLAILLWISGFALKQSPPTETTAALYSIFIVPVLRFSLVAKLLALMLVILQAFLLNEIIVKNEVLSKSSNLPALLYIVFMSFDNYMLMLHPTLFSNFFILLIIYVFTESYKKQEAFASVFNIGALFAIATLFYFPCVFILPVLCVGLFIFRPFVWREWVICIIGIGVPYFFVFAYYFWINQLELFVYNPVFFASNQHLIAYSSSFITLIAIVGFLLILSVFHFVKKLGGGLQKKIKATQLLTWLAAFSVLVIYKAPSFDCNHFSVLIIPVSVYCSEYFLSVKKRWWAEFLFSVLLISVVINLVAIFL